MKNDKIPPKRDPVREGQTTQDAYPPPVAEEPKGPSSEEPKPTSSQEPQSESSTTSEPSDE